ncbi:MAG: acyl-CoA dehydrogenase family protein [Candidatus Rokubacteria bacterium]|nr:acyl-CoA dehydrogenase family protein [Candidatus Rokubacteria bacterium]
MMVELTAEQEAIRQTVNRICREHLAPRAADMDRTGEFPWDILAEFAKAGLTSMFFPVEYGGLGKDLVTSTMVVEEISKFNTATAHTFTGIASSRLPLLIAGSEEQKRRYMPRLIRETGITCLSITEPNAGSDVAGMETRAERDGDSYVLNGRKCFATNGSVAALYFIFAVTQPGAGARGISCFLVERGTPGLTSGRIEDKVGLRASNVSELILEDVRVPAANRIGAEGEGFRICMLALDKARLDAAALGVGLAQGALDYAVRYAKSRVQFNQPVADFQGMQFLFADMATSLAAARALTYQAARRMEHGDPATSHFCAMAKLFASDMAMKVTVDAVQALGGYGVVRDHPVERMMRDAKILQIFDGTNQIQRVIIARGLLR